MENRVQVESERYIQLQEVAGNREEVSGVVSAGEYAPTHKSAGLLPYDAVIVFNDVTWSEKEIARFLDGLGVEYCEITGVTANERTQFDGGRAAFIALVPTEFE